MHSLNPKQLREKIRNNEWAGLAVGLAKGYVHASDNSTSGFSGFYDLSSEVGKP